MGSEYRYIFIHRKGLCILDEHLVSPTEFVPHQTDPLHLLLKRIHCMLHSQMLQFIEEPVRDSFSLVYNYYIQVCSFVQIDLQRSLYSEQQIIHFYAREQIVSHTQRYKMGRAKRRRLGDRIESIQIERISLGLMSIHLFFLTISIQVHPVFLIPYPGYFFAASSAERFCVVLRFVGDAILLVFSQKDEPLAPICAHPTTFPFLTFFSHEALTIGRAVELQKQSTQRVFLVVTYKSMRITNCKQKYFIWLYCAVQNQWTLSSVIEFSFDFSYCAFGI